MQENKKSSVSLWVGVTAIGLTFLSAFASGASEAPSVELTSRERSIFQQVLNAPADEPSARCKDSVSMMKEQGDERSEELLMSTCLSLPSDHEHICGIPTEPGTYSIIENDRCNALEGGIQQHAHVRKVEARERTASFYEDVNTSGGADEDGDGSATGAQ